MASRILLTLLALASVTLPIVLNAAADDPAHVAKVEAWRAKHEADYTREYVPLAGLFFLSPGVNRVGSAPSSQVRLPARAPAAAGQIRFEGKRVQFEPQAGVPVTLNGERVASVVALRSSENGGPDEIVIGDIALWVHMSGERYAIRLRDPQGEVARSFLGFRWFPIDGRYRVVGRLIRDAAPREVKVASLTGDDQTYTTEGVVEFTLLGQRLTLRPMTTRPNRFFFIFRDATSGKETYEAARFLYADLAADGTTVLDFNEAYNPPCAFNPFTTCPLPPRENRLAVGIPAGERNYPKPPKLQDQR